MPAQILVSEILSSDLLTEKVLDTFEDAHRRLLAPDALVIPRAATAMGASATEYMGSLTAFFHRFFRSRAYDLVPGAGVSWLRNTAASEGSWPARSASFSAGSSIGAERSRLAPEGSGSPFEEARETKSSSSSP